MTLDFFFSILDLLSEPESIRSISEFWRAKLGERMSLGCYEEKDGVCKLVALNVCSVTCQGDEQSDVVRIPLQIYFSECNF